MPRLSPAALALAVAAAPLPASAQMTSWWDLLDPDRLIASVAQYGIMALRTQVRLVYGELTVDGLAGRVTLTDLELWPAPAWDEAGDCRVTVDRLVLQSTPPESISRMLMQVNAYNVHAPADCLPPDARPLLGMAGQESVAVPNLTMRMTYDIATASADVAMAGALDGIAAFDLAADFAYLWVDGREDMEDPEPVARVRSARLSAENLGGWQIAQQMLPPGFGDPEQAPMAVRGLIGSMLAGMNREAAGETAEGDPSALSPEQTALVDSAVAAWTRFLADPQRLVLETGLAPGEDVLLDIAAYEEDPRAVFADLQPRIALIPSSAAQALPAALVSAALAEDPSGVSPEDRLRVGRALVSGEGAPRNVPAGTALLVALARDGDGAAADALSAALEHREPENSYGWGLRAGEAAQPGATARLDRLERVLPFAEILRIQGEVSAGTTHPVDALASVSSVKAEARARLTGWGQPRSYGIAALWAMIAKAAGDPEGAAILAEIDDRVRRAGPEAREAWAPIEAESSQLALDVWLGRDLPATYGGQ